MWTKRRRYLVYNDGKESSDAQLRERVYNDGNNNPVTFVNDHPSAYSNNRSYSVTTSDDRPESESGMFNYNRYDRLDRRDIIIDVPNIVGEVEPGNLPGGL